MWRRVNETVPLGILILWFYLQWEFWLQHYYTFFFHNHTILTEICWYLEAYAAHSHRKFPWWMGDLDWRLTSGWHCAVLTAGYDSRTLSIWPQSDSYAVDVIVSLVVLTELGRYLLRWIKKRLSPVSRTTRCRSVFTTDDAMSEQGRRRATQSHGCSRRVLGISRKDQ